MLIGTEILVDILSFSINRKHLNSVKLVNRQFSNCISHFLHDKPLHFVEQIDFHLKSNRFLIRGDSYCCLFKGDSQPHCVPFKQLAQLPIPVYIRTLKPVISYRCGCDVSEAHAQILQLQKHIWQGQTLFVFLSSFYFTNINFPQQLFGNTGFQCSSLTVKLSTNKRQFPIAALLSSPAVLQCDNVKVIAEKTVGSGWDDIVAYFHHTSQSSNHRKLILRNMNAKIMYPDVLYLWHRLLKIFLEDVCPRSYTLYLNFSCKDPYQEVTLSNPTTNEQLLMSHILPLGVPGGMVEHSSGYYIKRSTISP